MAIRSLYNHGFFFFFITLCTFPLLFSSSIIPSPISAPEGMLAEAKTRLGSMPPSCHNRCNECHPCKAVEVPTLPQGFTSAAAAAAAQPALDFRGSYYSSYPNYKPLGWKCRCRNTLFNP